MLQLGSFVSLYFGESGRLLAAKSGTLLCAFGCSRPNKRAKFMPWDTAAHLAFGRLVNFPYATQIQNALAQSKALHIARIDNGSVDSSFEDTELLCIVPFAGQIQPRLALSHHHFTPGHG